MNSIADPFKPETWVAKKQVSKKIVNKKKIVIQQILNSPSRKFVVLNNKIYQQGDRINGLKITAIKKNRIHLDNKGTQKIIYLTKALKK